MSKVIKDCVKSHEGDTQYEDKPQQFFNSEEYYLEQIEKWTKKAAELIEEIKKLKTKSTWDKEEIRKLMKDSFHKGIEAESFQLPIDFDTDVWIEEEINKTILS